MAGETYNRLTPKMCLRLAAPHTWLGPSVLPTVFGGLYCITCGYPFSPVIWCLLLLVALFAQSSVNTLNDWADFKKGTDTIENRCRFAREVAQAVRKEIGRDMAIEMRMSGDERLGEGLGMGIEDMAQFAEYMQDYVDLLHVSSGNLYDMRAGDYMIQGQYMKRAVNVELASYIKKRVHIPVVSVGKFTVPLAEEHIAAGDCDMVAMIRQFIADPDCLKKARAGHADDIRPCIRCNACTGGGPGVMPKPTPAETSLPRLIV